MSLDFKIYAAKRLIASTSTPFLAAHLVGLTSCAIIKHAGRIVWNEAKDRFPTFNTHSVAAIINDRVKQHRKEAALAYKVMQERTKSATGGDVS